MLIAGIYQLENLFVAGGKSYGLRQGMAAAIVVAIGPTVFRCGQKIGRG